MDDLAIIITITALIIGFGILRILDILSKIRSELEQISSKLEKDA